MLLFFDSTIERTVRGLKERNLPTDPQSVAGAVCGNLYRLLVERAELLEQVDRLLNTEN